MRNYAAALAGLFVVLGLGATAFFALSPGQDTALAQCSGATVAGGDIGGPFTLVDDSGATVTDTDVIDGLSLIYFGFTYCPDVCPLDTVRNADAIDLLQARGIEIKPVFVTIDPARDTPEVLSEFVSLIHDDMVGLTGTQDQIDSAIKAYRVFANRNGEGEDYLMDHSTFSYLMAPDHGLLTFFRRSASPEAIAETTACFAEALG